MAFVFMFFSQLCKLTHLEFVSYTQEPAALNNVLILCFRFPIGHFGVLFGFIQFAAGIAGLLQYPLFEWAGGYEGSFDHVSLLCCK